MACLLVIFLLASTTTSSIATSPPFPSTKPRMKQTSGSHDTLGGDKPSPSSQAGARRTLKALVPDPQVLQAYSAVKTVIPYLPNTTELQHIPVLAVVGVQSSGKTSFLETLVGFPIGFTAQGTGTRCPVRYIIRSGTESYDVGGKSVNSPRDVSTLVKKHMQSLGASFSEKPLVVQIAGPDMLDIDVTDLPGLRATSSEGYAEIRDVVSAVVNDPQVCPIVMLKAQENVQTQIDADLLKDVGIAFDDPRALFVLNYFNKRLVDMHQITTINGYVQAYSEKFSNVRFVMLHYKDGINKDEMNFEELSQYYADLPENEIREFNAVIQRVEKKDASLISDLDTSREGHRFGVTSTFKHMLEIVTSAMKKTGIVTQRVLLDFHEKVTMKLQDTKRRLIELTPATHKKTLQGYVEDWDARMAGVLLGRAEDIRRGQVTNSVGKYEWAHSSGESSYYRSFLGELEEVQRLFGHKLPELSVLNDRAWKDALKGSALGQQLDMMMGGHAAYRRALKVYKFFMHYIPMRRLSLEEAFMKSGHSVSGMTEVFDTRTVVKQTVTDELFRHQDIFHWLVHHLRIVYELPIEFVSSAFTDDLNAGQGFVMTVNNAYKEQLAERLDQCLQMLNNLVRMSTNYIAADYYNKHLLLFASLPPLDSDVLSQQQHSQKVAMDISSAKSRAVNGHAGGARFSYTHPGSLSFLFILFTVVLHSGKSRVAHLRRFAPTLFAVGITFLAVSAIMFFDTQPQIKQEIISTAKNDPPVGADVVLGRMAGRGTVALHIALSKEHLEGMIGITRHATIVINPSGLTKETVNISNIEADALGNATDLTLDSPLQFAHEFGEEVVKRKQGSITSASIGKYQHVIKKTQQLWLKDGVDVRGAHALIAVESAPDDIPQMALTAANVDILNIHAERHYNMLIWRLSESVEMELNSMVHHYVESRFLTDVRKRLSDRIFEMDDNELAKGVEAETIQKEGERDDLELQATAAENALRHLRNLHKRRGF